MKVLVDTPVWSIALRHKVSVEGSEKIREELYTLIDDSRVVMIGPIRQELLSGIKSKSQFNLLKEYLEPFRDVNLETEDYILAANFFNRCRSAGVQGSHTDFLICAVSSRREYLVFTTDNVFLHYRKHLEFSLLQEP